MVIYCKALVAFCAIAQTAAFIVKVPKASTTRCSFLLPSFPCPSIILPFPRFQLLPTETSLRAANNDTPPGNNKPNVLIVIRHGEDVDNDKRKKRKPGYYKELPNGEKIYYDRDGLNKEGKKQAQSFAKVLPKLVKELGISDITRIITKDPKTTPNPFDTILPFIDSQDIMDVRLPSTIDGIKKSNLFPDETSVLVCFDAETLWSKKDDGKRTLQPSSDSLLHFLNQAYDINDDDDDNHFPGPPQKGHTVYIYRSKGTMDLYKMVDYNNDGYVQMH